MLTPSLAVPAPNLPAVLDIEASGFGAGSYPIEIGFVLPDGRAWCSLIRPEADWQHWDPQAAAVHHIQRDQLLTHGRSPRDVADTLNEQLRSLTVYTDAWGHDYPWLSRLYDAARLSPTFKLEPLLTLLNEHEADRWNEVKHRVADETGLLRHRASADARLLQQTWAAVRKTCAVASSRV